MEKLIETLGKLLPADQVNEAATVVTGLLDEAKAELQKEFDGKLEEAYQDLANQLSEGEKTAYQGYQEALTMIAERDQKLNLQKAEFQKFLDEQYAEAKKLLEDEKAKNQDLEAAMYEEYDSKLNSMKEFIVDKVDQFLQVKGKEIYEQARRDILNDPRMAEHKVVLDKIVELTSNYLSEEDIQLATTSRVEAAERELEKLKATLKQNENANNRLSRENTNLNKQLREAAEYIKEHAEVFTESEKKERVEKAANVQGKGKAVLNEGEQIVKEQADVKSATSGKNADTTLVEQFGDSLENMKKLAGV